MSLSYVSEKLHAAILILAGTGSQKERLVGAIDSLDTLQPEDFPEKVRQEFSQFWEKFHATILTLADTDSREERLVGAIDSLDALQPEDFPEKVRQEFSQFWENPTRAQPQDKEESIETTVNSMDHAEVHRMIERIIGLHDTITRLDSPTVSPTITTHNLHQAG